MRQELGSADNVIYISLGLGIDVSQNVMYLTLDVGHGVDISHDWNLEDFLAVMNDNSKYKVVIWMKEILIKERSSIQNSKVGTSLDNSNDF